MWTTCYHFVPSWQKRDHLSHFKYGLRLIGGREKRIEKLKRRTCVHQTKFFYLALGYLSMCRGRFAACSTCHTLNSSPTAKNLPATLTYVFCLLPPWAATYHKNSTLTLRPCEYSQGEKGQGPPSKWKEYELVDDRILEIVLDYQNRTAIEYLSLIHIWRCRRSTLCRSRWSPYH